MGTFLVLCDIVCESFGLAFSMHGITQGNFGRTLKIFWDENQHIAKHPPQTARADEKVLYSTALQYCG